jgi:glyceraldehyde 3-phosphate dehydrogenase
VQREAGSTDVEIVVNDLTDIKTLAHLLNTTPSGRPSGVGDGDDLMVGDQRIKAWSIRRPAAVPWGDHGVDVVIESTGRYTAAEQARGHLHGGGEEGRGLRDLEGRGPHRRDGR